MKLLVCQDTQEIRARLTSRQKHLAMSNPFRSHQQKDEYARPLSEVSQVKKLGFEVTMNCHYSIRYLRIVIFAGMSNECKSTVMQHFNIIII